MSEITHLPSLPVGQPNSCSNNAAIVPIILKICYGIHPQRQVMNHIGTPVSTYHKNAVSELLPFSPCCPLLTLPILMNASIHVALST